jgi:hypothetical protein
LSGHKHDSKGEARYCDELHMLQKLGYIKSYEIQRNLPLTVNDKTVCHHRIDFVVVNKEGKEEFHEFKGFETDVWRLKHKLTIALYPETEYIVVK